MQMLLPLSRIFGSVEFPSVGSLLSFVSRDQVQPPVPSSKVKNTHFSHVDQNHVCAYVNGCFQKGLLSGTLTHVVIETQKLPSKFYSDLRHSFYLTPRKAYLYRHS